MPGNRVELRENGEEYYPRVLRGIAEARIEIIVEAFLFFDGSSTTRWAGSSTARSSRPRAAGVGFHVYSPQPRLVGLRSNIFRRLHRKVALSWYLNLEANLVVRDAGFHQSLGASLHRLAMHSCSQVDPATAPRLGRPDPQLPRFPRHAPLPAP